jgi:hypothetical protein
MKTIPPLPLYNLHGSAGNSAQGRLHVTFALLNPSLNVSVVGLAIVKLNVYHWRSQNEIQNINHAIYVRGTASVVLWSEFLATDPEVPGSIPVPTRFSEK